MTVPLLLTRPRGHVFGRSDLQRQAKSLGAGSALLVISGYHAELTVTDDLMPRRTCRFILMTYLMSEMQPQTMYDMLSVVLASTIAKPRARGFACLRSMTCTRMQC